MDYEKKYKEALARARKLQKNSNGMILKKWLWNIFPELKESRDNRIMKVIRGWIYTRPASFFDNGISKEEILAWLEKQGKQEEPQVYETKDGEVITYSETNGYKIVEPKFHEGDWVIDKQGIVHQIANVVENVTCHTYGYDIVGGGYFNDNTEGVRLWTIQDAKEGDVLACESGWTCIFKSLNAGDTFSSYCFMDRTKSFFETGSECHTLNEEFTKAYNGEIKPATKEQRDLLFAKMKEDGYEWDSQKKELRKVGQNPTEWSDDDERNIQNIDSVLFYDRKLPEDTCVKLRNFLKTLKERIGWKPSEEQISSLRDVIYKLPHQPVLFTLYNDLKKLKGE